MHCSFLDPVVDAIPLDEARLGGKGIVCTPGSGDLKRNPLHRSMLDTRT